MKKIIERPKDLSPRGIRSTYKGAFSFEETFKHIYQQIKNLSAPCQKKK